MYLDIHGGLKENPARTWGDQTWCISSRCLAAMLRCCMLLGFHYTRSAREFTGLFKTRTPISTLTVRWYILCAYSLSPALFWCELLGEHVLTPACSGFCVQYKLFTAFHYYLSVLYISEPRVSVKQSSHSNFILITNRTHSALYLKGTGGS